MDMSNAMAVILGFLTTAGIRILLALVIYVVGRFVIGKLIKLFGKLKAFTGMDETARNYIMTFIKATLYVILGVAIIAELGVNMASVIAVIASCGVAVGLAMQGALSNLAGGIMLLIFRPFNVGDYIIAGGEEGVVKKISLIYTVLNTVDNKQVSIPNGSMMNANISNASAEDLRRVDLTFNIDGGEPIKKVQAAIMGAIIDSKLAMADPTPQVEPLTGIPGGLQYTVRVWCKTADYWDLYFELMREIPAALGIAGIAGPSTPVKVNK